MNFKNILDFAKKGKEITDIAKPFLTSNNKEGSNVILSEGMTEDDENNFINRQISSLNSPSDVLSALGTIAIQAQEAVKFCEVQKTKRAQMREQARVEIARINAMSDMINKYLDKTFDERRYLFQEHFKRVDKAIANGDKELLSIELQNINQLAASSPFKALADINNVRETLDNKLELDI